MINPQRIGLALAFCALGAIPAHARAQGLPTDVVPLHSFPDVPDLPQDVSGVIARYGDVSTGSGSGTEKGDVASEPLRQRVFGWMKESMTPPNYSAMAGGAGAMNATTGQAIGDLISTMQRVTTEFAEAEQNFGLKTLPPLKQAYEQKLDAIHQEWDPKIDRCLTLREERRSCTDPTPQLYAAINAASTAFLQSVEGPYTDYRNRMQAIAAEGEAAIDRAGKVFGKTTPALAQPQITGIRQNELTALMAPVQAESDLVSYVRGYAMPPFDK